MDAVVRGRVDDEHVPAVGHEAEKSDGDARSTTSRPEGDWREHGLLQQDVRVASEAEHAADSLDSVWFVVIRQAAPLNRSPVAPLPRCWATVKDNEQ